MTDLNDPVYREIVAARVKLLFDKPFFGNLAARLIAVEANDWCKTAATDGRHLYYNREFIKSLDKAELLFLIGHEVLHCFPAGTIVPGQFKTIENVRAGDNVVGRGGSQSKVVIARSRQYDGKMHTIKARGMLPLDLTSEHPVLVTRPAWKTIRTAEGKKNVRIFDEPMFVVASEVKTGDWVQVPRIQGHISDYVMTFELTGNPSQTPEPIKAGIHLNQQIARFLGLYVAEGSTSVYDGNYSSCMVFNKEETNIVDFCQDVLKNAFGIASSVQIKNNAARVCFSSKPLGLWFKENCGSGAANKRIPDSILYNKDLDILKSFMAGYVIGDGCVVRRRIKNGLSINVGTVSAVLAYQTQSAWARLGVLMNLHKRKPATSVIRNRVINSQELFHGHTGFASAAGIIGLENNVGRSTKYAGVVDEGLFTPVTMVSSRDYSGLVYNLETECHTYSAGNIMTHNCVYDTLGRRGGRDSKLYNMASDFIINYTLVEEKCGTMPKSGLYDKRYTDEMSSEEVYALLEKDSVTIKMPLDEHLELGADGDDEGNGSEGEGNEGQKYVNVTVTGKNGPPKLSDEDVQRIRSEIKAAVIQSAQQVGAGKVPAGVRRMIDDLLNPKLDWRALLDAHIRSSIKDDYTFSKISRRTWSLAKEAADRDVDANGVGYDAIDDAFDAFAAGVVPMLPAQDYMDTVDVAVAIDCSGSMSEEMLRDFLSETKGIMTTFRDFKVRLWVFDTEVYNYKEFTAENISEIDEYGMAGGGGTMFECNWEFMKRQGIEPQRFVMFTDGYPGGTWGDPNYCDTLFVVHGSNHQLKAPFGITTYYEPKGKK